MKKIVSLIMAVLTLSVFTACSNQAGGASEPTPGAVADIQEDASAPGEPSANPAEGGGASSGNKILIAYFSSLGNIAEDEEARGNVGKGYTKTIAEMIGEQTGGELFFIETAEKYPANYNDTIDVAMQELRGNARPELAAGVENFDEYDVVFIGYPIWWGTIPQALLTFFEEHDFSGKTVIPFCTYQDSGIGRSIQDIKSALPDAAILEEFSVRQADVSGADDDVAQWLSGLDLPDATSDTGEADKTATDSEGGESKMLVAYFSMPETADASNMTQDEDNSVVVIDGEVLGNTQYIARLIQENTGADIFRIERNEPYPTDHDTLLNVARQEQDNGARPELSGSVDNIGQYDVIFIGYPNWWADMPMTIYTFLEEYDLSGKTIVPFNTHGGSGFSNTIRTITELQPNAAVEQNGFSVSRNSVDGCESDVVSWLSDLGLPQ